MPPSAVGAVMLAIVLGIIAFITVVGNIMVMISFKMDKQLQTISNYFLFRSVGSKAEPTVLVYRKHKGIDHKLPPSG